jgi:putative tributyrin esterase
MGLISYQFTSKMLELSVSVNVLVPGELKKDKQYPVLYLLHGYMGNQSDWLRYTALERYMWEYEMIVVIPDGHQSYYTDFKHGLPYFSHIALELTEHLEMLLPISKDRKDHSICGLSMGGYGAMKIALTYPEKFGHVGSFSGALNPDQVKGNIPSRQGLFYAMFGDESILGTSNDLKYLIETNLKNQKEMPDLYMACGTEDFLYQTNLDFKSFLESKDISFTYFESKGAHTWHYWDQIIQRYLRHINKKGH